MSNENQCTCCDNPATFSVTNAYSMVLKTCGVCLHKTLVFAQVKNGRIAMVQRFIPSSDSGQQTITE